MFFEEMMNSYWAKKSGKKKGFTLVEMLVVVAIIAALASIMIPTIQGSVTKSAAATNAANLRAAKGAFTTLKLMYPEDYSAWTGGFKALTGIEAVNEEFVVSASGSAAASAVLSLNDVAVLSSGSPLTVPAPNAVQMTAGDVTILEGTPMNAQIIKNEDGVEEVYVTYDGYPIAFFAEIAENGTADGDYYLTGEGSKGSGNLAANKAYIDKYTERANTVLSNIKNPNILGNSLFGNLIDQMGEIATDVEGQGDCIQCAMNKLDTSNMGYVGAIAGDKVTNKLTSMGYDPNGSTYCVAYNPVNGGPACSCDPTHGPEAHISTTSKIQVGAGYENCPKGGLHEYQYKTHECIKCGYKLEAACPTVDTSIPYLGMMLDGECMYCGYCDCCAKEDSKGWFGSINYGGYDKVMGLYDAGVCMSADPLTGGSGKGCGHTAEQHARDFAPKTLS